MDRILDTEEFFKDSNRMKELAGVNRLNENADDRLDLLDDLREFLTDVEILDTLFGEVLNDGEAEEYIEIVARLNDVEFDELEDEED